MKRKKRSSQATRVVALSFGGIILVGTLLLMLPAASASGESCGLMTALFTATSATCVTGLTLVDTVTAFSPLGQVVILLMIQLGGLGFMTVLFLLVSLTRHRLSLSQRLVMVSAFNLNDMSGVLQLVRGSLRFTACVEGVGAVVLILCFLPRYGMAAIWKGIFISISAFCNAGFDLFGSSLISYNDHPLVLLTVSALVICGGLGFIVWEELLHKRAYKALSLYSKIVLWMTAGLLLVGTAVFLCVEFTNPATLGEMPVWQKVLNAFFQSVTLRTAGFSAIDQGGLKDVTVVVSILLMLVGGSSGSTAGGLKTGTLAVLLLSLRAGLRGSGAVTLRGWTIPQRKVLSAMTLTLVMGALFLAASMAIALIDGVPYLSAAYEAGSALGTVGLTTGITGGLSHITHGLLIAMMYLGRVGVLSFSLAFLTQGKVKSRIGYPESDVMIG